MRICSKDADGMANSIDCIDRDQTPPLVVSSTIKFLDFWTPTENYCKLSKIQINWSYRVMMCPKDAVGMANSVDRDQTAPLVVRSTIKFLNFWTPADFTADSQKSKLRSHTM